MHKRFWRPALIVTCALLVGAVGGASSAQAAPSADGVTVNIGAQARLRAFILVTVPIQITCPAGFDNVEGSDGPLEQAAGQAIANTTVLPRDAVVCDGTPHQVAYSAMANPAGPPFHAGEAVIRITIQLCNSSFECVRGDSGFAVIQLKP